MKLHGILHAELVAVIARMGHTDSLVIADAGLPIPSHVQRIDLALVAGVPSFLATLHAILGDLCVERSLIASEMEQHNQELYAILIGRAPASIANFSPPPNIGTVTHADFKAHCAGARAVVRSGEMRPYANIILYSGVNF